MAVQDYNTISQPPLGVESSGLGLAVSRDKKKQRQRRVHLAAVLKSIEVELASAKSGATLDSKAPAGGDVKASSGAQESTGPSNASMKDMLAAMAAALQFLQVEIAKYANKKASSEGAISKAELAITQQNLNRSRAQLEKLQHAISKQKQASFWERLAGAFVGVVLMVAAVVLMQPELLIAAALCFALASGVLGKFSDGMASLLEEMGVSSKVARILGAVIVTLFMIACTFGAASVVGAETTTALVVDDTAEAVEDGIEISEVAEEAASDSIEEISMPKSSMGKAKIALEKINIFAKLSPRTNLLIQAGLQSAMSTQLIDTIAGEIAYEIAKKTDKKDAEKIKQRVEQIVAIIVAVLLLVASIGSTAAISEGAGAAAKASGVAAGLGKDASTTARFMAQFRDFATSAFGQRMFDLARASGSLAQGGAGVAANYYTIEQGLIEELMGSLNGDTVLNNSAINMNSAQMRSSQQFIAQREKGFKTSNRAIVGVMKGEEAFSQLLTSSMV